MDTVKDMIPDSVNQETVKEAAKDVYQDVSSGDKKVVDSVKTRGMELVSGNKAEDAAPADPNGVPAAEATAEEAAAAGGAEPEKKKKGGFLSKIKGFFSKKK